ncbi:tryptophanyl-tRNA synthetase, putative [Theileria equi strain WA]|uniref:tryptophan--tRNA ligase n=1 Tax=Theileria equi strain WA TaxID=1537102 RepID=L0AZ72_THEEQ|nr:tryptophanyl-tRNA synthetase, putative [Theileria equi strain WA]AFZ80860.1 tryptophanyl-tRNA synthetase, putative [Theileria equi strain WA]|eukprot:XP_004830526.1 tryptophanyl-tRNA synthetase, putative [Theileria equi strain WA]
MVEHACSFVESSFHIIKGAACTAFSIPTARTTKSIKRMANNSGIITLGKLARMPSESDYNLFKQLIRQKLDENAQFKVLLMDRELAESVYGDSMYDEFLVPSSIKRLRLVILDEWNINANIHKVLRSTGLIQDISIKKLNYKDEHKSLDIHFNVTPGEEILCEEKEVTCEDECPPKVNVLPPGEVELDYESFQDIFSNASAPKQGKSPSDLIDYNKLTVKFGCTLINQQMLDRMQSLIDVPLHPFLRRGLFFCHRGLGELLDVYAKGGTFFVYTGRGPSTEALHLGHLVPFMFTCWLQKAFKVPVMIMLSDDEKFVFREELEYDYVRRIALENAKDIIACGFDPDLTLIFRNTDYVNNLYPISLRMQKKTPFNQLRGTFGFDYSSNVGMISYPTLEGAAAFSHSYPTIFGNRKDVMCLVPQGIDQDPFFRLTRDLAPRLGLHKPSLIHSKFVPSLLGVSSKMSSSLEGSAIFVTDDRKTIHKKIHKYAFSGGRATAKEHKELGPDLSVDVSYQYLCYLLEDDKLLEEITQKYSSGDMLTGELKNHLVDVIVPIIEKHQELRKNVDDAMLARFMDPNRECFKQFMGK